MKVCCYDCGKTDVQLFERPRTVKSGMKNTVDVCKKCQIAWYKKHKMFLPRYNFKCPKCGHEQSASTIDPYEYGVESWMRSPV